MQTDVYIKINNEKMKKKILDGWILVIPAIIAFGFMAEIFRSFFARSKKTKSPFEIN